MKTKMKMKMKIVGEWSLLKTDEVPLILHLSIEDMRRTRHDLLCLKPVPASYYAVHHT